VQSLVRDLNRAYRGIPSLHVRDCVPEGFRWVVGDDADQSVFAYLRLGEDGDKPVLAVCNFTPVPRYEYRLGVPVGGIWREIVNTDAQVYGGSGVGNGGHVVATDSPSHGHPASLLLTLPPLATLILQAG
jgi:1,4-alpha-glucan branching enzyme